MTENHLKLLRRVYADSWHPGEGNAGAAGINPKKPYGNSNVERDVAEILDAPDEDWIYEQGEKAFVTDEAAERFMRLHVETMFALQIVPAGRRIPPGPLPARQRVEHGLATRRQHRIAKPSGCRRTPPAQRPDKPRTGTTIASTGTVHPVP